MYSQTEIDNMKAHGVKYKQEKGRDYVEINTPDCSKPVFGDKSKFRTDYMNVDGDKQIKKPDGSVAMYSSYSADQLIKLSEGKPVNVEFRTTSNVERNETQMLAKNIGKFGKIALRPTNIDKINEQNMYFEPAVYEPVFETQKQSKHKANQNAINKAMAAAAKFEQEEAGVEGQLGY